MKPAHSLDDVLVTYLDAERLGQAPAPQALLATYPDLAGELQSFFADREQFRRRADSIPPVPFARLNPAGFAAPPRTIGNYEIVGELGRGGMGVVYKALQPKLKRLVALKMVLHAGHASPRELARFRTEGEAVARLQHPNIIHIYEVGEFEGRPFFSLEFVDGGSLAQRINGRPQPTRQAAALVETLAQAMDYAHRQGIVHRDLKPANVLLTAQGMPKITDFGLAKRLGQDDGQTRTGAILGTPSYIAPEQAAGKKDVGPAADIYALGAILYEMLTGRPPFRGETPMDTMLQVMSSQPVPPARLQPKVPRDLETICLKCLEKEPKKRYASAAVLAIDLRRFLNGESISARPAGNVERAWRWCRRRPLVAALILAVVFTGFSGVAGVFSMWRQAEANLKKLKEQQAEVKRQRDEADKQRKLAEENLRQAREAVNTFFITVSESPQLKRPGLQPLRKQLLEGALRYYQDFLKKQNGKDPAVKKELAVTYFLVARITAEIGSQADALKAAQKSLDLRKELLRASPNDWDLRYKLASSQIVIGRLENNLGRADAARRSYERAEEVLIHLLDSGPSPAEMAALRLHLSFVYSDLGHLHSQAGGRLDEAIRYFEKERQLLEALAPGPDRQFHLTHCYNNLAINYDRRGQSAQARALMEKALPLAEQLARGSPNHYDYQSILGMVCLTQGGLIKNAGNPAGALPLVQRARDIMNRLVQRNPAVTSFQSELANCDLILGETLRLLKRPAEGIAFLNAARDLLTKLHRDNPTLVRYRPLLAQTLLALGAAQFETGQVSQAQKNIEQSLELWGQLVRDYPANASFRNSRDEAAAAIKKLSEKRK